MRWLRLRIDSRIGGPRGGLLVIVGGFLVSRILFAGHRISFYDGEFMWQTVDFNLLRTHLAQSIFFLHSQPPLLNLFLGLVLKLTPDQLHAVQILKIIYQMIGFASMAIIYYLMVTFSVPVTVATVLTLLFEFNPGTLMLESWYYTAYPTQLLFLGAAFSLHRFLDRRGQLYGTAFLVCATLPIFLNSSFQPIWFIVVCTFCWLCFEERLRELIPAGVAMLVLLCALVIKNAVLFGVFTTSSWFGMNLARVALPMVSWDDQRRAVAEGKISNFVFIQPFEPLDKYPGEKADATGIPVLDERKKANGVDNFNNILYIDISRHYLHDSIWTLAHHPIDYSHELVRTCGCYFGPHKDQDIRLSSRLGRWNRLCDYVLGTATLEWWPRQQRCVTVSLTLLIGLPLIFIWTAMSLRRATWDPSDITRAFMLMTIAYTSATAVMLEIGENPRFRSVVDPLFLVLLGCLIGNLYRYFGSCRLQNAMAGQEVDVGD